MPFIDLKECRIQQARAFAQQFNKFEWKDLCSYQVLPGPHGPGVGHGRLLPGTAQSKRNLSEQAPQADPDHPYGFAQLPSRGYQQSLAIIGWRYNRRPLSIALVEPRLALDRLIKPPSSDQFLTTYIQLSGRGSRDSRNLLPSQRNPELFSRPLQRTVGAGDARPAARHSDRRRGGRRHSDEARAMLIRRRLRSWQCRSKRQEDS